MIQKHLFKSIYAIIIALIPMFILRYLIKPKEEYINQLNEGLNSKNIEVIQKA